MEKIKLFIESDKGKDILVVIIIILVGLGSFEIGRLSKNDTNGGLKVQYDSQEASNTGIGPTNQDLTNLTYNSNILQKSNKLSSNVGNFFASSKGSKYYSMSCSAGKTIKQENRIYFSTAKEAEQAGYQLSSACK